jgi:hypothetical protein
MKFLILRSYGDFMILLSSLKSSNNNDVKYIYISKHLKNLYNSLSIKPETNFYFNFIDFNIKTGILPLFTNKLFFKIENLYTIINIRKFIIKNNLSNEVIYLEQKRKLFFFNLFIHVKTNYIHKNNKNIYDSYFNLFQTEYIYTKSTKINNNIVIFPDSRKKDKMLSNYFIDKLQYSLNNYYITIARFDKKQNNSNNIYYSNFDELISIIDKADLIISSDSLPAHLAQYFEKPHFIMYNNNINHEWVTPFSNINNTFYITKDVDRVVTHINKLIC